MKVDSAFIEPDDLDSALLLSEVMRLRINELVVQRDELVAQRNELAATLRAAVAAHHYEEKREWINAARAVLAKVQS